ncbi:hypothetical protein CRM89_29840 [Nocardia sp. FDAARGOS_372]|uniref:Uncharacterized protein n=1 Tax=Nocardia farcinica (strain IFM 10152) TaxID=247156 RepID=Q5YM65_NOCFA|nr:hypothetical protein CRM89_29840 [Nocardia sp. FDAARGOS_372]BAD60726.1 hypothetical protein PNF2_410 [Nocardia farcinica IFM 10152]
MPPSLAALDWARGANPDFADDDSGFFAAADWMREAASAVILPPSLSDFDTILSFLGSPTLPV